MDGAIRNLIREGKTPQIRNAIQTTGAVGNILMERAVQNLFQGGAISRETMERALQGPAGRRASGRRHEAAAVRKGGKCRCRPITMKPCARAAEKGEGVVEAASRDAAVAQIRRSYEVVLSIKELPARREQPFTHFQRLNLKVFALMCRQFSNHPQSRAAPGADGGPWWPPR